MERKVTVFTTTVDRGVFTSLESAEEAGATQPGLFRPVPVCPVIVQPELDIEVRLLLSTGAAGSPAGAHVYKKELQISLHAVDDRSASTR